MRLSVWYASDIEQGVKENARDFLLSQRPPAVLRTKDQGRAIARGSSCRAREEHEPRGENRKTRQAGESWLLPEVRPAYPRPGTAHEAEAQGGEMMEDNAIEIVSRGAIERRDAPLVLSPVMDIETAKRRLEEFQQFVKF